MDKFIDDSYKVISYVLLDDNIKLNKKDYNHIKSYLTNYCSRNVKFYNAFHNISKNNTVGNYVNNNGNYGNSNSYGNNYSNNSNNIVYPSDTMVVLSQLIEYFQERNTKKIDNIKLKKERALIQAHNVDMNEYLKKEVYNYTGQESKNYIDQSNQVAITQTENKTIDQNINIARIFDKISPYYLTRLLNPSNLYTRGYLSFDTTIAEYNVDRTKVKWTYVNTFTQERNIVQSVSKIRNMVSARVYSVVMPKSAYSRVGFGTTDVQLSSTFLNFSGYPQPIDMPDVPAHFVVETGIPYLDSVLNEYPFEVLSYNRIRIIVSLPLIYDNVDFKITFYYERVNVSNRLTIGVDEFVNQSFINHEDNRKFNFVLFNNTDNTNPYVVQDISRDIFITREYMNNGDYFFKNSFVNFDTITMSFGTPYNLITLPILQYDNCEISFLPVYNSPTPALFKHIVIKPTTPVDDYIQINRVSVYGGAPNNFYWKLFITNFTTSTPDNDIALINSINNQSIDGFRYYDFLDASGGTNYTYKSFFSVAYLPQVPVGVLSNVSIYIVNLNINVNMEVIYERPMNTEEV